MVFHWSLSDSKSPQVSRTRLSILAVLSNAVVWTVSTCPTTSKSSRPFNNPLVTVPNAPITIGTSVIIIIIIINHNLLISTSMSPCCQYFYFRQPTFLSWLLSLQPCSVVRFRSLLKKNNNFLSFSTFYQLRKSEEVLPWIKNEILVLNRL